MHVRHRSKPLSGALALALAAVAFAGHAAPPDATPSDYVERMAHEHGGETPTPTPATVPEPARPVVASDVGYATLDGTVVRGYLARPKDATGPLPAILLVQEWWGLNDNMRALARRLAGEGYAALAVDLYEGRVATDAKAASELVRAAMSHPDRLMSNLRQAHAYLARTERAKKIGVVGWCFGGAWALETALALGGDIRAAVVYYGNTESDPKALANLKAPLLGFYGGQDQGIPVAGVRAMEKALHDLGKEVTIVVYPDATHAFANPSGEHYDAAAAADAWAKTVAFFARHLKS